MSVLLVKKFVAWLVARFQFGVEDAGDLVIADSVTACTLFELVELLPPNCGKIFTLSAAVRQSSC